jgi:hypothetical protein
MPQFRAPVPPFLHIRLNGSYTFTQTDKAFVSESSPNLQGCNIPFLITKFVRTAKIPSIHHDSATVPQKFIELIQDSKSRCKGIQELYQGQVFKFYTMLSLSRSIGTCYLQHVYLRSSAACFYLLRVCLCGLGLSTGCLYASCYLLVRRFLI